MANPRTTRNAPNVCPKESPGDLAEAKAPNAATAVAMTNRLQIVAARACTTAGSRGFRGSTAPSAVPDAPVLDVRAAETVLAWRLRGWDRRRVLMALLLHQVDRSL
jgi:hypothetical protein